MDDDRADRQRRLQREMSDRFAKSYNLRKEQERIEKRMADLEEDFQDCQNSLRNVKERIKENETVRLPFVMNVAIADTA